MSGLTLTSTITSRRHPLVQRCRRLAAGRGEDAEILLDGEHLLDDAIAAGVRPSEVLARDPASPAAARAAAEGARVYRATTDVLEAASPVRTPSGVVAIAAWRPAALPSLLTAGSGVLLALVDVQDPGNVGSVIRSADALGALGVCAVGATADPGGWRALRGAMGSTFRLPIARAGLDALLEHAERAGARVLATTITDGESIAAASLDGLVVVLLGSEGSGLPPSVVERAEGRLHIPMREGVNSLNVAVAAALILYEAGRDRSASRKPSR